MAGETSDTLHPPAAPWDHGVRCEWDDGWSRGFRSVPAFGPDHMVTIRQDSLEIDYVDIWRIDRGATIN